MSGKDFLFDISNVESDLIEEAEASMNTAKKRFNWYGLAAAVACLCVVVACAYMVLSKNDTVVYAKDTDYSMYFAGEPSGRVEYMTDFSKYGNDTLVRVMIMVYDAYDCYPEILYQKFDGKTILELNDEYMAYIEEHDLDAKGTELWEDLSAKENKVYEDIVAAEIEFFKSIGAEDIEEVRVQTFLATIRISDLAGLESGVCRYRVAHASKEATSELNPGDIFGEYEFVESVYTSLFSSTFVDEENLIGRKLTISEDSLLFDAEGYDKRYIPDAKYQVDTENDNIESNYGLREVFCIKDMPEDFLRLLSNEHMIIAVTGSSKSSTTLFIGDGYLYMLHGMSIFKFKAI